MNNVPKLRFKGFSDEWEEKQLSEMLYESKLKNKDLQFKKEDVLSVSGEYGIVNQIQHLGRSYAGVSVANYGVVKKGDIVYTKSPLKNNPYGIIKANKCTDGIVSTLYAVYSCKENFSDVFIDYYFQLDDNTNKYVRPLVQKGAKNDMKINNQYFLSGTINVPKRNEQEKIANFLTKVDKLIEKQDEKVNNLEQYKKGMMQRIFSQEIRFKKDDRVEYPEWTEISLDKICTKIGDGLHATPNYVESSDIKFINGNNIKNGKIVTDETTKSITIEELEKYPNYLSEDTVLMSINGTIGNIGYYCGESVLLGKSVAFININKESCIKEFIGYVLASDKKQNYFYSELTGTTIKNLSLKTIRNTLINLPILEEQTKISNFLSKVDSILEKEKEKLEELRVWKKGLLQGMFV